MKLLTGYFHGACAPNLFWYLYLPLTACQIIVQYPCAPARRVRTCYGTFAHSHIQSYAYKIKHTLKRKPNKSLTSGGFRGAYTGETGEDLSFS